MLIPDVICGTFNAIVVFLCNYKGGNVLFEEITKNELNTKINKDEKAIVIYYNSLDVGNIFMESILEKEIKESNYEINTYKINIGPNTDLIEEYFLHIFPSTLFFKQGKPIEIVEGLAPKSKIKNIIQIHFKKIIMIPKS